ncbi:uncharacterized protein LOC100168739 isoform X1 [Acyrthosiphon pisum]|uniref:Putative glycoprotein hormone-beta5 n=1 Tax=Acyrthosiphon pisum TaxID=7029 RepID=C6SUQ8_ACYPI|nr:Thyrostimulin beta-5 subunit precursor [Acyrthosiphon pisum]XP_008187738.1 uncharacterized protein LOC100168739 isoform X1 [Acyrthosiphon pisum]CAR95344.2 TPA: putative glycoprotein hormone-beta5 [Acyrthosiphon pisum]|eukprot:NP_001232960.1 uncharacterized protein LOC100168739 precursor [Acyrthosiphon pisum]
MVCMAVLCAVSSMIVWSSVAGYDMLDCNRQLSTFQVSNTDENGRTCSDEIDVMSCWGRCDSNEVSDWRFPFKRSHHPVCIHDGQVLTKFMLKNCEEGVQPGTEFYVFPQAMSCKCHTCKSSEAACEGYRSKDFPFISPNQV